jgi:geranylgeranyl diphosphate synthase, type III
MQQYTSKKGFADDLTEGKFSFPVIHAIHADTNNREVISALTPGSWFFCHPHTKLHSPIDVLHQRPSTPTLKIHAIDYLKNHTKSFEYTLSVLDTLETQMRREIQRLGGNQGLEKLMDMLHINAAQLS